jgi:hypothetical protein
MAKVKQTVTKTKTRVKTGGKGADYIQCNMCHGTGRVKNGHKSKKN